MELVHLNDSVKREGTNGDSSESSLNMETNLVPIKVSIKDLNLNYVFHNASDVARGRLPRYYGGTLVDADAVAFGTLDQDTLRDIKTRFINTDFESFDMKRVYFQSDLNTLGIGAVKGAEINPKPISTDLPKRSNILKELHCDMIKDKSPKVLKEVLKIPLTPFNYWDIYKYDNVITKNDGVELKLKKGAKIVGPYDRFSTVMHFIDALISENNVLMEQFKYYPLDEGVMSLVRILEVDCIIEVIDGRIWFAKRDLPTWGELEWRAVILEPIRRMFVDRIVAEFNGVELLHSKSKSLQALIYAWIVDDFVMTDDIRIYLGAVEDIKLNCYSNMLVREGYKLSPEECVIRLWKNLDCARQVPDTHLSGKVSGMPHRDMSYGRADDEMFRIELAMESLEQIDWRNRTNRLSIVGHLSYALVDSLIDYRKFYGGGNTFRFSSIKRIASPFDKMPEKGTQTMLLFNDAVMKIMSEEDGLRKLVEKMDKLDGILSSVSSGIRSEYKSSRYNILLEVSSTDCIRSGLLNQIYLLGKKVSIIYPDGPHFIIWIIIYGILESHDRLEKDEVNHLNILYRELVEANTYWYFGSPDKSSLFKGLNRRVDHGACYFYAKRSIRRFRSVLQEAFESDNRITSEGVEARELFVFKYYEDRVKKFEEKKSKKKNS